MKKIEGGVLIFHEFNLCTPRKEKKKIVSILDVVEEIFKFNHFLHLMLQYLKRTSSLSDYM